MWAAIRDNVGMLELLLLNNPNLDAVDKDGWNALDHAILKINYKAARVLTKAGLQRRPFEDYDGKTWRKYDIQMMFDNLDADAEDVPYSKFFDLIKKQRMEWLAQDLVVDRREGYREYIWRQLNFGEAPLVPREDLPLHLQP
jgi:ankyrin repeat protein